MTLYPNKSKTKPRISSRYGAARPGGRKHEGTDFIGYEIIHAVTDGVVTWAGYFNDAAGYAVVYEGKDPITGENLEFRHFHPEASGITVRKGNRVREGQALARMGHTGNATGDCDHFEIRKGRGGIVINSEAWLDSRVKASPYRKVVAHAGSNGRERATTASKINQTLAPNTVGKFNAWTNGQTVEGNNVWYRGAYSGDWFWSGGFVGGADTSGLKKV